MYAMLGRIQWQNEMQHQEWERSSKQGIYLPKNTKISGKGITTSWIMLKKKQWEMPQSKSYAEVTLWKAFM
jgi:hypothetical protein